MVTHDAHSASYSDRVIFLDDGKEVAEVMDPSTESILDMMKQLGD
jgi:putative ABC transport system ATP-binding protein